MSFAYDDILYPGQARTSAHPDRLAAIGRLHGVDVAPMDGARVLELGCGNGANLIAVAYAFPELECVGVDLSERSIEVGRDVAAAADVANCRLDVLDIMAIDESFGQFDYIVAHGLYSWVPATIQNKVLEIFKANLSTNGIGFISYNTYPGWHMRDIARNIMRFHATKFDDPNQIVAQARGILQFVVRNAKSTSEHYRTLLAEEQKLINDYEDEYLFHDDIAEFNEPVYFTEFVERIERHGLQFISEADFCEMNTGVYGDEVSTVLGKIAGQNLIVEQQMLDFVKGRRFRQSLVCHANVTIDRVVTSERLSTMYVESTTTEVAMEDGSDGGRRFRTSSGFEFTVTDESAGEAFGALSDASSSSLAFEDLVAAVAATTNTQSTAELREAVAEIVVGALLADLVTIRVCAPRFVSEPSEYPIASLLARTLINSSSTIVNMRHQRMTIDDEVGRMLLPLLDGSRSRSQLVEELARTMKTVGDDSKTARRSDLEKALDIELKMFASHALLIA